MRNSLFVRSLLGAAIAATSASSFADLVLEEVVVTAQLRAQSLQDVPISVSAVDGSKIAEAGITKIEDLQSYVPNFSMSETGVGTNIYIRGIGSGINQGFEQSVAQYVDGIYYGRAQLSRAPFLDLERVEVLRGPQNILYGKNSIAGALNIVTAEPTDEFEGMVSATYEPRFGETIGDVVLSGPLTDTLGARFAYRNRQLDGYLENNDGGDEPERDEQTARLTLQWDPTDELSAKLKAEHGTFDVTGRQIEIIGDEPSLNPALGGLNWSQFLLNLNNVNPTLSTPASILDITQDGNRSSNGDFSNNDTDNVTLNVTYQLGDYEITSITGYLSYSYEELCDCDFTSANSFTLFSEEDYDQVSQEFRIVSPAGEDFEWLAGAYYQDSSLDFADEFTIPLDSPVGTLVEGLFAGLIAPGSANATLSGLNVPRTFNQDSEIFSAFFQGSWQATDSLRLTVGGRYSYEEKTASRRLTSTDANGVEFAFDDSFVPGSAAGVDYLLGRVFLVSRHQLDGEQERDNFSPLVTVEYDINNDWMAYATWTRGFKSGGFDVRSNTFDRENVISNALGDVTIPAGSFEFEEEKAETIELGFKATLADGRGSLNAAYFHTQYEDLQVSIFDGRVGFNVGNAAEAITQGIELDGRWKLTESITIAGALAWLDFEFDDYPNGQCTAEERIRTGEEQCDFSGFTNQYVADWSGNFIISHYTTLGENLQLSSNLDAIFTTDFNPSQNVDPNIEQDGYVKWNARVALGDIDDTWEVAVVGKNLTDEEIVTYANDTPLSASFGQSVGYYGLVEPGRTVAIQGTYRF